MAHSQFCVLKRKGRWMIKFNEQEQSFSIRRDAILAAIKLANEYGKEGRPSVVLLEATKDRFETIWTYGESPFPPSKSNLPALLET